jgi:hypothetical protein
MNQRSRVPKILIRILQISLAGWLIAAWSMPVSASQPNEREGTEQQGSDPAQTEIVEHPVNIAASPIVPIDCGPADITSTQPCEKAGSLPAPLANALSRSTEGLKAIDLPAGGQGVPLDGRFQHVLMVKVTTDGSLAFACVDSAREAREFLQGKATLSNGASADR